ncbi:MAG: hypothetical protein COV75_07815 [Candidatus Omnitrophica bacterium CG11_big_fil_rev_8_21_14_0_20_63_9]|nr:MAG: hypothetical protein COV75_07815 [Candidatus Omnitrophica bacterium CG11_big_fil_rev_8_21_14_0_20_63_9]
MSHRTSASNSAADAQMEREEQANATVHIVKARLDARVVRVVPDAPKVRYLPGQYGSLGLPSATLPGRWIKRPYSVSSSILEVATGTLIDPEAVSYYEFYVNRVDAGKSAEPLTPRLFTLNDGDRIFCGRKIVGYYTLHAVPPQRHLLFVSTTTGESANNAMVNQALRERPGVRVCQVLVAVNGWRSLYAEEHAALMRCEPRYRYVVLQVDAYAAAEARLGAWLQDARCAADELGFVLDPAQSHVFLCGDPALIGAPTKQGAWRYERSQHGLIRPLTAAGFSLRTRFQPGTVDYEAYW